MIVKIRKRDSTVEKFDPQKITRAIHKAFASAQRQDTHSKKLSDQIVKTLEERFRAKIPSVEDVQNVVEEILIKNRFSDVAKAYILYRQKRAEIREAKKMMGVTDDLKLSVNASVVLERRYLIKDEQGNVIESPKEMFRRVASAIADVDKKYGKTLDENKKTEEEFYNVMANFEFLPNSPTLMNAGTELGQLSACFTGEQPIITSQGIRAIKDIKIGDIVLTASGKFSIVTKTMQRLVKKRLCIDVWKLPSPTLSVTHEHPIIILKDNKPEWIRAGDIRIGDHVAVSFLHEIEDIHSIQLMDFLDDTRYMVIGKKVHRRNIDHRLRSGKISKQIKPINNEIMVDKDFMRFLGYYASEGDIDGDCVRFTFSKNEEAYINDLIRIVEEKFGLKTKIETSIYGTWINVRYHSHILSEFIRNIMGHGFDKKTVPLWMLKLPPEKQIGFVIGCFRGDSTLFFNRHTHNARLVMCNQSLVYSVWTILMRMGIVPRLKTEKIPKLGKATPYVCTITSDQASEFIEEIYLQKVQKPTQLAMQRKREIILNGIVFLPIRNIEQMEEEVQVYNFEVDREHTYVANCVAVHNCFVLPVEDSLKSIFDAVEEMALIHQSGGGTGFSFSHLRPKGDVVRSTHGVASGPVSFMRVFDTATDVIKQGGKRRGASMGILSVDHPDIIEFITSKTKEGFLTNFNTSVAVTDDFMSAVEKNKDYDLINPRTKKPVKKVNARDIFNLIVSTAWRTGDPGLVFIDEINRNHPLADLGNIEATNPCLSKDTWILTEDGPYQIYDVINKKTLLAVDGEFFESSGFFETGKKNTFNIKTKEGYEIKATDDHPFLVAEKITRYSIKKNWKTISQLKKGDYLVLSDNRKLKWKGSGSFNEGYLLGLIMGDGYVSDKHGVICVWERDKGSFSMIPKIENAAKSLKHRGDFAGFQKITKVGTRRIKLKSLKNLASKFNLDKDKKIKPYFEKTSYEFYQGFLMGFFDTDGSVQGNLKKGFSIRLWQNNLDNLKTIQRMLQRLGIISSIYKRKLRERKLMPDGKGGQKNYDIKEGYEIIISKDNISIFAEKIGFSNEEKQNKLLKIINSYKRKKNRERFVVTIDKIEKFGIEKVFDASVPETNSFDANGFIVHNCGEAPLLPYESCNLGSINLAKMVTHKDEKSDIDFEKLRKTIHTAVHFLDNIIDANKFPLKKIEDMTKSNRKIGLGVMGFADMLVQLGIPYDSDKALSKAEKIIKFISDEARKKSISLAEGRGSFPNFNKSSWAEKYKKMRNAILTTIAPTGTLSIIADCSSGIEPFFAISYARNVLSGAQLLEVNKYFEDVARKQGFYNEQLMAEIAKEGTLKNIKEVPDDVKRIFVMALDISPEWHVKMQAAFQKYTDNAVSKTINLPSNASIGDVEKAFMLAWRLRCKGITVYRYGSKPDQVLYIGDKTSKREYTSAESHYSGGCPTDYCEWT